VSTSATLRSPNEMVAAWPGDPGQLAQRRVHVGHVAQPERDRRRVERSVRERERQRVAGHHRHDPSASFAGLEHA
jgi:hypothetical protein